MERGRRLGIDVGTVRVGVAICDPDGLIATPLATLNADGAIAAVRGLIAEYEIVEVIIGLPLHLKGTEGISAQTARLFAEELSSECNIPITLVDERLSTSHASRQMQASGRSSKDQRSVIDQAAATSILQLHLDQRRSR